MEACPDTVEEDLKEDNWVGDVLEERVDGQFGAKVCPVGPMGIRGGGTTWSDSKGCRMLRRAPITEERITGGGVQRRQDLGWG